MCVIQSTSPPLRHHPTYARATLYIINTISLSLSLAVSLSLSVCLSLSLSLSLAVSLSLYLSLCLSVSLSLSHSLSLALYLSGRAQAAARKGDPLIFVVRPADVPHQHLRHFFIIMYVCIL